MNKTKLFIAPYGTEDWKEFETIDHIHPANTDISDPIKPYEGERSYTFKLGELSKEQMDAIHQMYEETLAASYKRFMDAVEKEVRKILLARFNAVTDDEVKDIVKKKNLALAYDGEHSFIGITANNRWLYTIDGRVIGKRGKCFKLEEL